MYLTERTAIKHRLESIRREKDALRDEIAILREEEKEYIQRLGVLDEKQADVIDAEAVIDKLADTAQELKKLIPEVPATDVIKAVAKELNPQQVITEDEETDEKKEEAHSQLAEEGKEQRYAEAKAQDGITAREVKKPKSTHMSTEEFIEYMKEGARDMQEFKLNQARNRAIDRGMPYMEASAFGNRLHYAKKQLGVAFPFEQTGRGIYRWKDAFKGEVANEAGQKEEKEVLFA